MIEQGDDIKRIISERTLVIANHQSTGDVPILMTTFNAKPNVLPNLMWIMDRIFKFTNFGVVSLLHQDFFISSVSSALLECISMIVNIIEHLLFVADIITNIYDFKGSKKKGGKFETVRKTFKRGIHTTGQKVDGSVSRRRLPL